MVSLKALKFVPLAAFLLVTVFPFYWIMSTSLKGPLEIYGNLTFYPVAPTLENYVKAFSQNRFEVYIKNSLIVTLVSSTIVLAASLMGGYALARYRFRGKGVVLVVFLASQMVPLITAIIPMFVMYSRLKIIDSLMSLILSYTVANVPFCLITMSAFLKRIPVELEEAALMDGCGRMRSVMQVVLPLMAPGIIAVFVFAFTGCWNELFYAVMMINTEKNRTIPVGLLQFVQKYEVNWGQMMAGCTITLIPVVVMFFIMQKHIVEGLTAGAVKG